MNLRQSLTVARVAAVRSVRFYINHVFNTPTKCTYTIKYIINYHPFSYMFRRLLRHLQEELFIYLLIYIKKLLPEDGAIVAETCRRKDDN